MPTNRELKADALALAEELGITVSVSGLNNAALVELVADLRVKRSAAPPTSADATDDVATDDGPHDREIVPPVATPAPDARQFLAGVLPRVARRAAGTERSTPLPMTPTRRAGTQPSTLPFGLGRRSAEYVVANDRSVNSRRGMLQGGADVRSTDFSADALTRLISTGAVVKREP